MKRMTLAGALAALTLLVLVAGNSPADASFTPTFSMTIDDNAIPSESLTLPSSDNCETNTVAFPGGIPCEMYAVTAIPAGDELGRADTSIPKTKFTIADGFPLTNGTPVGSFGFSIGVIVPGPGCLQNFLNIPGTPLQLVDAALPSYLAGPWAGDSNGGDSEPGEASGPAALYNPNAWPINVESDPNANALWAADYPLIARYFGIAPTGGPGTAVNILVFESPTAYVTTMVIGNPLALPGAFCTAFTTRTDYFGSTTDTGTSLPAQLRQCNAVGIDQVTATFTPTVGAPVSVSDAVNCSLAPGVTTGTVTGVVFNDLNANGTMDGSDVGVSGLTVCALGVVGSCTTTLSGGTYSITAPAGNRVIYVTSLSGVIPTTPINQPVTVPLGGSVTANFGRYSIVPPPPEVTVGSLCQLGTHSGLPVLNRNCPIPITKDVTAHCGSNSPLAIKLVVTPIQGTPLELTMTNSVGENWVATIPGGSFGAGLLTLQFHVDCPPDTLGYPENISLIGPEDEIQQGGGLVLVFIDPSGFITDACTGNPLVGATVTLLVESPEGSGNFVTATTGYIPDENPETSDSTGHYGWLVIAGKYKVRAQKAGFSTEETVAYDIPPEVTDANLSLTPTVGCGTPTPTPSPSPTPGPTPCAGCPVGGIVGLTVADSGSGVPWAGLTVGGSAALAALAAGLWYGRRRWLR